MSSRSKRKKREAWAELDPHLSNSGEAALPTLEEEGMEATTARPARLGIDEKMDGLANGMFSVTTATIPTGLNPAVVDHQAERFHGKSKLYYLGCALLSVISVLLLFGIKFADDLDIEDWAEDPMVTVLAYGGLVGAFYLWRKAEQHMDKLKTLVMMLRNYYAHREGQIARGELKE